MTDTVPENTGNDGANVAPATNEVNPAEGNTAPQSVETSAPQDTDTPKEGDGKVTEADKDNTTPEQFEFEKLKLPEGITVTDEQRDGFLKDAESLGITTQEGAQRFIDWVFNKAKEFDSNLAKQQEDDIGNLEKQWDEEGKKDPVLGKDYDKNVNDAMETAGQIFSHRTMEFLKDTRFEKNPDFLKDMLRLHKERADAELISGRTSIPETRVKRDSQGNPMLTFK